MIAPARVSVRMFSMSMRFRGDSRWQMISGWRSLSVTAAARLKRFDPDPDAMAPREVEEQGRMTIPWWRNDPEAMEAPTSLLGWTMRLDV